MREREFDIILYGASGYAAKYIIKELEHSSLKIALASRSCSNIPDTFLPKLECTIENIHTITSRTRVLLNCVGPYAITGILIIKACISTSTDYVDISGEPAFMSEAHRLFGDEAKNSGIKVVYGCGFDSVIADIGCMYLSKMFDSVSIDSTLSVKNCQINFGTWKSLLTSLAAPRPTKSSSDEKKQTKKPSEFRYNKTTGSYDVLFRGSDPYVVRKTAQYYKIKNLCKLSYTAYLQVGSLFYLAIYLMFGLFIRTFIKYKFIQDLLLKYPTFFTVGIVRHNPSEEALSKSSFEMVFRAQGVRNKKPLSKSLRIAGPDPGYKTMAICASECAYTLIDEDRNIPSGVKTPAAAFYNTRIVERLESKGIVFDRSKN